MRFVAVGGSLRVGVGFAIGLFGLSLMSSLSLTAMLFTSRRLGIAMRSGMMMAVYEQVYSNDLTFKILTKDSVFFL